MGDDHSFPYPQTGDKSQRPLLKTARRVTALRRATSTSAAQHRARHTAANPKS